MADYDPRRAEPGEHFEWRDGEGNVHRLKADDEGVARPHTEGQKLTADAFGLPVARAVAKAEKPATKRATTRPEPVVTITPAVEPAQEG